MDCGLPDSSVHEILQERILEWLAMPSSRGSSQSRDQTHISYVSSLTDGFFNTRATCLLFSCSVVSDSLWPHGLQHTRLPCPSPFPGACSDLCPSSQWCHPTISSSHAPFSSCLQSFPTSGSFPMSQFFASGGQSIGASASASASVLSMNIQDWFPLELTDLISLQSRGLSSLLQHHSSKASVFDAQLSLWSNSYTRTPSGKTTKGG